VVRCDPPSGARFPLGTTRVTCRATDAAGNEGVAQLTVTVFDASPPVITAALEGTRGDNNWYVSPVRVRWTVVDSESAIIRARGCEPSLVNADTAEATFRCAAVSAGGEAAESVSLRVDMTPPSITGARSPEANELGWNDRPVTVRFACADALSGVRACGPSPQVLDVDGAGQSVVGDAVDEAGNAASARVAGINIDRDRPRTGASVSPVADGWSRTDVRVALRATDPGASGVQSITYSVVRPSLERLELAPLPTTVEGSSATIAITRDGEWTIRYLATDRAGNRETANEVVARRDTTAPGPTTVTEGSDGRFRLSSSDGGSGVTAIFYQFVRGSTQPTSAAWTRYGGPFSRSCEGVFTLWAFSLDNAGNRETPRALRDVTCVL
jgi:hypothetical protein